MTTETNAVPQDGDRCLVVGGTHAGKAGVVRDINTSKTGHVTITVVQENGERFKTLARNVTIDVSDRKTKSIMEIRGLLEPEPGTKVSIEEMNRT